VKKFSLSLSLSLSLLLSLFAVLPVSAEIIDINGTKIDILYGFKVSSGYYLKLSKDQMYKGKKCTASNETWIFNARGGLNAENYNSEQIDMMEYSTEKWFNPVNVKSDFIFKMTGFDLFLHDNGEIRLAKINGRIRFFKYHGKGTKTWPDGKKYTGEWKDGNANGKGTFTWSDGEKYTGEWKDGKQNGKGTKTWSDGEKYTGEWKDGKQNGKGTKTWPDGKKYTGEWKDGNANGKGTFTWPDGGKYIGEFKDGTQNGKGTQTWSDGGKYIGEFKDGTQNGKGTKTWPDGKKYTGGWKDGNWDGKGTETLPDGTKKDWVIKDGIRMFEKATFLKETEYIYRTIIPGENIRPLYSKEKIEKLADILETEYGFDTALAFKKVDNKTGKVIFYGIGVDITTQEEMNRFTEALKKENPKVKNIEIGETETQVPGKKVYFVTWEE